MRTRMAVAVAALAAAAPLCAPLIAHADPVAPQLNTPCSVNTAGALTRTPDGATLQCRDQRWQLFTDPYPLSGRWLSYGPVLTLHGQGRRNPEIMSGLWTGYPQDPATRCSAEQVPVVGAGVLGPPQVAAGEPGQPLALSVVPTLFTVALSGDCLWQKAG